MPIRIENKEMRRVKDFQALIYRQPDTNSALGEYKNPQSYHHGQLPVFIRVPDLPDSLRNKPKFYSRVPAGGDFNAGPSGSESPCKLNMLDILSLQRHWCVLESQNVMKGTMAKKFTVTAEEARRSADTHAGGGGTTHNTAHIAKREAKDLQTETPLTYLPAPLIARCDEASHSHFEGYHFPMGFEARKRREMMETAKCDAEVQQIFTANDRGHGDLRNESENTSATPQRLIQKKSNSPDKLHRSKSAVSMLTSGTMVSNRTFHSPGLPEEGFAKTGFGASPSGLPHIVFGKGSTIEKNTLKMKPWAKRRGSISVVKSMGWGERDLAASLSPTKERKPFEYQFGSAPITDLTGYDH